MPIMPDLSGRPLDQIEPMPVRCVHVRLPARDRPYTMLSGGRIWNLCEECHQRLMGEWEAVAAEKRQEWLLLHAEPARA